MNRNILTGLALILASYAELLIPKDWAAVNHFAAGFPYSAAVALFCFGVVFLGEGITRRFGGMPLLSLARGGGWVRVLRFVLVGAAVGIVLEVFAQWIGKLWFYAYYPTWFYWPSLVPSFLLYWVVIMESYVAAKAVLDHFIKQGGREDPARELHYHAFEPYLYGFLGTVGAFVFIFATVRALAGYWLTGGFEFNVWGLAYYVPPLRYILSACLGLWFVMEGMLFARQKPSFLRSVLHGYFVPVLAVLLASTVLSLVWESQNALVNYWVYMNWPWPDLTFLGVQVSVLLTWPTHYVIYAVLAAALVPSWAYVFFARPAGHGKAARAALKKEPAGD